MSELPGIKDTALYKMCTTLYSEYYEAKNKIFNKELEGLLAEVIEYLQLDAYEVENRIIVTFELDKRDIPDGGN